MDPGPPTLVHIKNLTGLSRNRLADILEYGVNAVAKWEQHPESIPDKVKPAIAELVEDFQAATNWLDDEGLTWDQVIPAGTAAMKLGISHHTLRSLAARKRIAFIDLGLLGPYLTVSDLAECRRP